MSRLQKQARGLMILGLGLGVAGLLGACEGHGKYTQAFKDQAEARMSQIKAGTSWDMANQQFLAGDLDKALKTVDQSIALNDKVVKSHVLRGRILIELGRLENSLESFDTALEIDPEHAEAHYFRGIVFERFSQPDAAFDCYQRATAADPNNPQYLLASAEMLIEQNQLENARTVLEQGASGFEHNAGIRQTLGHIAQMQGRSEEAVRLFNEAYLLAPDDAGLLEDLTRAQIEDRDFVNAEYNLRRLIQDGKEVARPDLQFLHARCLVELDRPVEARTILQKLTSSQAGSNDVRAWVEMGHVSCLLKDQHRLRESATRVISMAPQKYEGYLLLGTWYQREGELDKAVRTLDRAVRLSKSDPGPAILQSVIYTKLGNTAMAAKSAQTARSINPSDPRVQALQGMSAIANVPVID